MKRWSGAVLAAAVVLLWLPARGEDQRWQRLRQGGRDQDRYDPFEELERIQRMMDRMLEEGWGGGDRFGGRPACDPKLDIRETEKEIIVTCDLPGMDKEGIEITLKDNVLTISGERERVEEVKDETSSYYRSERVFGSFSRSVRLPAQVDEKDIKAEYRDGVLAVTLRKLETAAPGGVKVKVL